VARWRPRRGGGQQRGPHTRTTDLVQKLQAARRDLALEAALTKLDKFHLLILDDITYAQKDQAESSVLFELIARRYEHRSLLPIASACLALNPFAACSGG
jgi:DNA replication protein DnaC